MCPHCDQELLAFELPDAASFEAEFHLACFNDECPYYVRGWEHLESNYAVKDCIIGASVDESDPSNNGGCP